MFCMIFVCSLFWFVWNNKRKWNWMNICPLNTWIHKPFIPLKVLLKLQSFVSAAVEEGVIRHFRYQQTLLHIYELFSKENHTVDAALRNHETKGHSRGLRLQNPGLVSDNIVSLRFIFTQNSSGRVRQTTGNHSENGSDTLQPGKCHTGIDTDAAHRISYYLYWSYVISVHHIHTIRVCHHYE